MNDHTQYREITQQDEDKIWEWNATLPPSPQRCISQVFSEQVKVSENALAIDAPDGELTYKQLDEYATRLALRLRIECVTANEIIPICFDKSIWLVVSMFAVSKVGAAYTTFDPTNPTERINTCIGTVRPRIMLIDKKFEERFSSLGINIISNIPEICNSSTDLYNAADFPSGKPDDLAYVCFTSGSTGLPKVVQHTQSGAVANVIQGHGYGPGSRVLNFASQAFAASVVTTLKTVANGGCLVLPPERERLGGIANFITRKKITRTFLTPTLLNLLKPEDVSCLQHLTVGGEPVTQRLIEIWAPCLTLVEAFGMTEGVGIVNVIDPSGKKCRARQAMTGCAWIVDAEDPNKLAPIGEPGELLIEGPTLCQGYRDNPEANSQAFIEGPPAWARKRGSNRPTRLFRTGDLAKYIEDGVIQIVGRKDTRVKLYGQRFELGEVEKAMLDCLPPGVTIAAEVIEPAGGNGPMLVAFIYGLTTTFSESVKRLRERLVVSLPDYMIPRGFVELKDRPLNPSGKLDRKLLRQRASGMDLSELVQHTGSSDKTAPVTEQEITMQRLWATVLNLPTGSIGLQDDFFYLGGSSLHCIKLIAEARAERIDLSIEHILENRTLHAMSRVASFGTLVDTTASDGTTERYKAGDIMPSIPEDNIDEIYPATDWQAWCIHQGLLKSHGWHDYMIFKFSKGLEVDKLRNVCERLVDQHSILRTVFAVKDKRTFQITLKSKDYPFSFTNQQLEQGQDLDEFVQKLIQKDIGRDTKLGDPLVAFMLAQDTAREMHQLILRISHAQYDAISLHKLWRSLEALYFSKPLDIVPFSRFCAEASLVSTNSESFWRHELADTSMTEVIPHPHPSTAYPINSAIKLSVPLVDLKGPGFTTATAVLASWSLLLSKLTDSKSVVFGNIISGRHLHMSGISDVLGPCMNIIPVHTEVDLSANFSSLLNSVQSKYLRALPHGHLGHRQIIEKSTNWPRWTRFSSVVNHLSFAFPEPPFSKTNVACDFSIYEPEHDKADLWLQTIARKDELEVELRYSTKAFSPEWVKVLVQYFADVYQQLPDVLESSIAEKLPILKSTAPTDELISVSHKADNSVNTLEEPSKELEQLVVAAWKWVLGSDFTLTPGFTHQTPFYEIWGDPIAASALAREYSERGGYYIKPEEVLSRPSIEETIAYLATCAKRVGS